MYHRPCGLYRLQQNTNIWTTLSNNGIESEINAVLADSNLRTSLIDEIVQQTMSNHLNGVNIDFDKIDNGQNFARFLIELAPRLRELGITTCVKINAGINENDIKNIVDYICY